MCNDYVCVSSRLLFFISIFSSSPYFQKIFTDNPCKHPIIVLKDVRGWEVQCIVDFMYKGETSVPESQLTSLIKAAESLKVRGLTSSDQSLPPGLAGGPTRDGSSYLVPSLMTERDTRPVPWCIPSILKPCHRLSSMFS